MKLTQKTGPQFLVNSINVYYQYNPDTLMPLIMLALAVQKKLSMDVDDAAGTVFASLDIDKVREYEWVRLDPALKKRIKAAAEEGVKVIRAVGDIPSEIKDIYETFLEYDKNTVVKEHHHRLGILTRHSRNFESNDAQCQYAALLFAEQLVEASVEWLQNNFLSLANTILEKSGIQPRRPRIKVAQTLCALLNYDGKGTVYNPFAGCALAGAKMRAGKNLYADGDENEKLLAAARLLCYGSGQEGFNIERRDSTKWPNGAKADYVLSTYLGYVGGKSAFDICLSHCLENFEDSGKFAGISAPKDIFEKRSDEMKEALRRDWVDSIVLLPFGEVAVLIDAAKSSERKNTVRFYNMTHPIIGHRPIESVIGNDEYAEVLKLSDVRKKGYLKSLVIPEIPQQDGCEIITLGDIYEKLPRRTWSLARVPEDSRVMAGIDRGLPYNEWEIYWMQGIEKETIVDLFSPAYKMTEDCLIVNAKGSLEPRLFDASFGNAFFKDGFAFKKKFFFDELDYDWLIHELCKPYVARQLHPYGESEMLPESFTEDQVLALKLNRPLQDDEDFYEDFYEDMFEDMVKDAEADSDRLPGRTKLKGDKSIYTIHDFLGHGYFGYTYSAGAHNFVTGEEKEVVLKEFYPHKHYHRDGIKACLNNPDDVRFETENRNKFLDEAKIMNKLGLVSDSHIVPAFEYFHSDDTDTDYYVMPFYKDGSLEDLLNSGFDFSEDMLINHVVIPMCKALNVAHKNRVLHLDIKPENILVDEHGDAVLIDFGVAKRYDEENNIIDRAGLTSVSVFAPPELKVEGGMVRFGGQPDIYGVAATLYYLATGREEPHPIMDFSDQDRDIRKKLDSCHFSTQFADAIVAGLNHSATSRPKNAQAFLNLFPHCENVIKQNEQNRL